MLSFVLALALIVACGGEEESRLCFPLIREIEARDILDKDFFPILKYEGCITHSRPTTFCSFFLSFFLVFVPFFVRLLL